jgi:uncharacterized membrane protein YdfJ with MMPL/SSD domain
MSRGRTGWFCYQHRLTLLPALLGFTGGRAARQAGGTGGRSESRSDKKDLHAAQRWASVVQKHPVLAAVLSAGFILASRSPRP